MELHKSSGVYEESLLGLRTSNAPNRGLRYKAYENPVHAKRGASRPRDMRAELLKERVPHSPERLQGRRGDASDLIELASAISISGNTRGESSRSAGNSVLDHSLDSILN
jgi:hypothetical protein